MMDIRDLRYGNYFWDRSRTTLIFERINDSGWCVCKDLNGDIHTQYINPIPLTPEWAERLGFKKFNVRGGYRDTRTWYRNHFFIYFGKKKGPKMNNKFPLPYVHNLQNLWWERFKTPLEKI